MFQRFFDEGLAPSSFLIACERTREAAIVDPLRDVDLDVDAAKREPDRAQRDPTMNVSGGMAAYRARQAPDSQRTRP